MSENAGKTLNEVRQAILNAIHDNAAASQGEPDAGQAEGFASASLKLAETYRLLDGF